MLKTYTRQANWRSANSGKYDAHLPCRQATWKSNRIRPAASQRGSHQCSLSFGGLGSLPPPTESLLRIFPSRPFTVSSPPP